jgi:DNA mismatch repair protein MutS2
MDPQPLTVLEYARVSDLLKEGARTQLSNQLIDSLTPLSDYKELQESLQLVSECVRLRQLGLKWSFSPFEHSEEIIERLNIEATVLEPLMILEMAQLCRQALYAKSTIQPEKESSPQLWEIVRELPSELEGLINVIQKRILPGGEIDDTASDELISIRRAIIRVRADVTRRLESLMRGSSDAIQDEIVTLRNERFVIPVKENYRGQIKGVAHGFSSSGATIFVEPLEIIEANNELQILREKEEREIERILITLTEDLRSRLNWIERSRDIISLLDFTSCKAKLSERFNCTQPLISNDREFELIDARHPLLEESLKRTGKEVVPVSFSLTPSQPVMVISGPNAGGKTVVLKTAGLLALMALSGLHVPAQAAKIPLYSSVLADIGDSQSLASNLSTFTAHISNISRMIEVCRTPSLVLLDEVGTGTDPDEGSALGVAIVDHFRRECGAHVIATTHYSGLKMYAESETEVINASVEFDEKTLQPTYRLITGMAGSSSGLDIARRFGFPDRIIEKAESYVNEASRTISDYLRRVKSELERVEELRLALEEERLAVAEEYKKVDLVAFEQERKRQLQFEAEMRAKIESFEKRASDLYEGIEEKAQRNRLEREAKNRTADLKREAQNLISRPSVQRTIAEKGVKVLRAERDNPEVPVPQREIVKGDSVRLKRLGTTGVVEQITGEDAQVRVGAMHFREKLTNLELTAQAAKEEAPKSGLRIKLDQPSNETAVELNLIGMRSDEAVDAADKFLDQAYLNNVTSLRIVHGHGTGALKRAVADLLRGHPHVEKFSPAPPDKGGSGATLVQLKS